MALPASFLDELRARTPMAALVGRRVKLARSGKSWKGCCPFHGEKTPSFYVYDDGYHCFGCGAHGDAIGFVMNTQGAGFMDAVSLLAAEAGLEVPKPSPAAAEAERQRLDLSGVLDMVAGLYQQRLFAREGAEALAYLRGRGLTDETIRRFGLGWSGEGRGALVAELAQAGIDPARMAEAGLLQARDDGAVRELFYNRVMFPIRDRRGRTISFGGRALGDAKPKYINGPESPVFSKGRTLYALDFAREGARKAHGVIVVEGYMDVIALHQAGFGGAVAPLGTALTAGQLEELWRLSDAPKLCFDGRRRRGAGSGPGRRNRAAAAAAEPHAEDHDPALRGGPGYAGPQPGRPRLRRRAGQCAPALGRAVRPAAGRRHVRHAGGAGRVPGAAGRGGGADPGPGAGVGIPGGVARPVLCRAQGALLGRPRRAGQGPAGADRAPAIRGGGRGRRAPPDLDRHPAEPSRAARRRGGSAVRTAAAAAARGAAAGVAAVVGCDAGA
ncbi:MAG: DNA primase [Acetobacteraceae bacterium]